MKKYLRDIGIWLRRLAIAFFSTIGCLTFLYGGGAPLWTQEAAGWMGAAGSFAAVVVALRIASRDSRRRKADELQVAQLHAAAIVLPLIRANHSLDYIEAILGEVAIYPETWPDRRDRVWNLFAGITLPTAGPGASTSP